MALVAGRHRPAALLGGLVVALYAWWVAGLDHFTLPALVAVLAAGLVVAGAAALRPPRAAADPAVDDPARAGEGARLWLALAAALVALETWTFLSSPRDDYPTLSSMADAALAPRPVEAAAFVAWLALGWVLARR